MAKETKKKLEKEYPKTSLLFTSSNTGARAQNLIFTVQIVATRVSNISSKFQLDWTTDEAGSVC